MEKEEVHYAYDGHTLKGQPSELATRMLMMSRDINSAPPINFLRLNLLFYVKMHSTESLSFHHGFFLYLILKAATSLVKEKIL